MTEYVLVKKEDHDEILNILENSYFEFVETDKKARELSIKLRNKPDATTRKIQYLAKIMSLNKDLSLYLCYSLAMNYAKELTIPWRAADEEKCLRQYSEKS